jgi:DNA mismatch endonuclease, patch repair protein
LVLADIVDVATRSWMMSGIRSRNTKPEMLVRSALHRRGFRFRLNAKTVPGRPDLVLPKFKAAIFVHGCFWHGHGCHYFKWPSTRRDFWRAKIRANQCRDGVVRAQLADAGWRQLVIWECAMRDKVLEQQSSVINEISHWLLHGKADLRVVSGEVLP